MEQGQSRVKKRRKNYSSPTFFEDHHHYAILDQVADVLEFRSERALAEINRAIEAADHDAIYDRFIGPAIDGIDDVLFGDEE